MSYPYCPSLSCSLPPEAPPFGPVIRAGFYRLKRSKLKIQRYWCKACGVRFSDQALKSTYYQKRADLNEPIRDLLCSAVSQRRCALLLGISRTTVVRKFRFMAREASIENEKWRQSYRNKPVDHVQFDDLVTSIHTKCKPASVSLAVDAKTRKILGIQVANIPARHPLVEISKAKYGPIHDERGSSLKRLFCELEPLTHSKTVFQSDCDPEYPKHLQARLPHAHHERVRSRRGRSGGFGELKRIGFDPLFSLNHACAMLRANLNRLARRTWCTSKTKMGLLLHLELYQQFHNSRLTP